VVGEKEATAFGILEGNENGLLLGLSVGLSQVGRMSTIESSCEGAELGCELAADGIELTAAVGTIESVVVGDKLKTTDGIELKAAVGNELALGLGWEVGAVLGYKLSVGIVLGALLG